jgi:hypothetical protein
MSIDKDPAVYSVLISVVVGLLGLLNAVGAGILTRIMNNQEKLFGRANRTDQRVTALEATCAERHRVKK